MPRPKKTDSEIQVMREQILDTALSILQESGPQAISSRAVAERLGVAHMSLFTYFKNQPAILNALREREMTKWRTRQEQIGQRAQTEDVALVVEELLKMFCDFARENPNLYRLAWVMQEATGESPQENRQRILRTVSHLATLLKSGMEQGRFEARDPFLAASVVLGMVNTPFILFHTGKMMDPDLRDQKVDEVLSAALDYLKIK